MTDNWLTRNPGQRPPVPMMNDEQWLELINEMKTWGTDLDTYQMPISTELQRLIKDLEPFYVKLQFLFNGHDPWVTAPDE